MTESNRSITEWTHINMIPRQNEGGGCRTAAEV